MSGMTKKAISTWESPLLGVIHNVGYGPIGFWWHQNFGLSTTI